MLTEEYQLKQLKEDCENYLVQEKHSLKSLMLADVLNLPRLRPACLEYAKTTPLARLKNKDEYSMMDKATLIEILESKVEHLEKSMVKIFKFVEKPDDIPEIEMDKALSKYCTICRDGNQTCPRCPALCDDLLDVFRYGAKRYIPMYFQRKY